MKLEADYIIVGAGAAGAVLAARLSADPSLRVLLVEAGGSDWNPLYRIPMGVGKLRARASGLWRYLTEPESNLDHRVMAMATGKVIGGSAAINGMVHLRPPIADYRRWRVDGSDAWEEAALRACFARIEDPQAGSLSPRRAKGDHPLDQAFLQACSQVGIPARADLNGLEDEGAGCLHFNIRDGRRYSTPQAYLAPARRRPNLQVMTGALVTRVLIDGGRARGVEVHQGGRSAPIRASREVIVAAGALRSPQLLMLSGIGPADGLRHHGIPVLVDQQWVGANLQNHVDIALRYACERAMTLHGLLRADRIISAMARAWLFGTGPAARFPGEVAAFVRTVPGEPLPDLLCHLVEGLGIRGIRWPWTHAADDPLHREGFSCRIMLLRPLSRGIVALRSDDPFDAPRVTFAHLSHPAEMCRLLAGVRRMRGVFAAAAFAGLCGEELEPGISVQDDAGLTQWIRARADMQCHPAGTCAMGTEQDAVVDARLRVYGVDGLRVADASIMPRIVGGGTLASTVMIAENAADLILRPACD